MKFFDCNICFGAAMRPALKQKVTAEELIEEMDFCDVDDALVFHAASRDDHPRVGNRIASEEVKPHTRVHACWSILPPQTEELFTTIEGFFGDMRKHGVWALRAFPAEHRFQLNDITFHELFDRMEMSSVPLLVPGNWPMVEQLLRDRPNLTVIANQPSSHGQDRMFRPLIEHFPNFYVDTTQYEADGGIAAFCKKYGPERMLFGSGFPERCMAAAMVEILHAEIPEPEKELIAAGNLTRLMKEVRL